MPLDPHDVQRDTTDDRGPEQAADELTVQRTATGYWVVQRGSVTVGGAMTQRAAERERDLRLRLRTRRVRRTVARV
jgi:hypothetical protein